MFFAIILQLFFGLVFRVTLWIIPIWNSTLKRKWISPIAERFKQRATHSRIKFSRIIEAEALIFLYNEIHDNRWYPNTAAYVGTRPLFRWFLKAKNTINPDRLAEAVGMKNWQVVKDTFTENMKKDTQGSGWPVFQHGRSNYYYTMCFES